jgi:hypothetical protein
MSAHTHLVQDYRRSRKIAMKLNHRLVETLGKDVMDEGGRKLGILKEGTLVLGSEDELSVLMDTASTTSTGAAGTPSSGCWRSRHRRIRRSWLS